MSCRLCTATNKDGSACRNHTCERGNRCWIHLRSQKGLMVKKSGIPNAGRGLYATRPFKQNKTIVAYTGKHIASDDMWEHYPDGSDAAYAVGSPETYYVDALNPQFSSVGRYINDCYSSNRRDNLCTNNAKVIRQGDYGKIKIKALKNINKGDEIFSDFSEYRYGEA